MKMQQKRELTPLLSLKKQSLLFAALLGSVFILFTGCERVPVLPDVQFAESYLAEQTYSHCKRYQRIGVVYSSGKPGRYVIFSSPEEISYEGWKIKNPGKEVRFGCMFRRYNDVGQVYHEMLDYQFMPLVKTDSEQYPYTSTMKIEFTCMDKLYHDDLEYNAGMVWLYEKSKYDGFGKLDLQNQFSAMWKPAYDLLLLTSRMEKDTASGKKLVREVPLRYSAENSNWQWQNMNGKWLDNFEAVSKLEEIPALANADLMNKDLNSILPPDVAQNNKILSFEFADYLCPAAHEKTVSRFLRDEFLFFCPGKKEPVWLGKNQYIASKNLLALANQITIEHKKVSPWQALQALNKHFRAIEPVQNIVWDHVEQNLKRILDMICSTDFIEHKKKQNYLNRFVKRLDGCTKLSAHPRFKMIRTMCFERLAQLEKSTGK